MSTTIPGSASNAAVPPAPPAAAVATPVVPPDQIHAVVPVSVSTAAKQSIVQRVEEFLARIEGDIAHDEAALVGFLKTHL